MSRVQLLRLFGLIGLVLFVVYLTGGLPFSQRGFWAASKSTGVQLSSAGNKPKHDELRSEVVAGIGAAHAQSQLPNQPWETPHETKFEAYSDEDVIQIATRFVLLNASKRAGPGFERNLCDDNRDCDRGRLIEFNKKYYLTDHWCALNFAQGFSDLKDSHGNLPVSYGINGVDALKYTSVLFVTFGDTVETEKQHKEAAEQVALAMGNDSKCTREQVELSKKIISGAYSRAKSGTLKGP